MERVSDMEGAYVLDDTGRLRANYADLVVAYRMHPFKNDDLLPVARELHETIVALNGHIASFIAAIEPFYLLETVGPGIVQHQQD